MTWPRRVAQGQSKVLRFECRNNSRQTQSEQLTQTKPPSDNSSKRTITDLTLSLILESRQSERYSITRKVNSVNVVVVARSPLAIFFCCCSAVTDYQHVRYHTKTTVRVNGRPSAEYWRDPRLDGSIGNVGHTVLTAAARQTAAGFKLGGAGLLLSPLHRRPGPRNFFVPAEY